MPFWTRVWQGWKVFARRFGTFQSKIILTLFYYIALWPFALLGYVVFGALGRRKTAGTSWLERRRVPVTLEDLRRQS